MIPGCHRAGAGRKSSQAIFWLQRDLDNAVQNDLSKAVSTSGEQNYDLSMTEGMRRSLRATKVVHTAMRYQRSPGVNRRVRTVAAGRVSMISVAELDAA